MLMGNVLVKKDSLDKNVTNALMNISTFPNVKVSLLCLLIVQFLIDG